MNSDPTRRLCAVPTTTAPTAATATNSTTATGSGPAGPRAGRTAGSATGLVAPVGAPVWASPARTTVTPLAPHGAVVTYESTPAVVKVGGADGGPVRALTVQVVVDDYHAHPTPDPGQPVCAGVLCSRDVLIRIGADLVALDQAVALTDVVWAAVETAAHAAHATPRGRGEGW